MDVRETLDRLEQQQAQLVKVGNRLEEIEHNSGREAQMVKAEALPDEVERLRAKNEIRHGQVDLQNQRSINELMQRVVALEAIAVQFADRLGRLDGQGVEDVYARSHQ